MWTKIEKKITRNKKFLSSTPDVNNLISAKTSLDS